MTITNSCAPGRSRVARAVGSVLAVALAAVSVALVDPTGAARAAGPADDPFYGYTGSTPLSQLPAGTVLRTRTVTYQVQGVPLAVQALQILYRTADQRGRAVANVTTVLRPPTPGHVLPLGGLLPTAAPKVVSYQSFYDSLNPADEPSAAISGGQGLGNGIVDAETGVIAPLLLAGYTVNVPDTEGQTADFASGPEYGVTTVDSLKAISREPATGVGTTSPIGLIGYSGGAIASEWAAELAPTRAPAIARRIVGTAIGGVLVKPSTNLHYIEGSAIWAGVLPMALIGIGRAFGVDLHPYLNHYGKQVFAQLQNAPINDALGHYPGLTWKKIAKKRYPTPESVPVYVRLANKLIMGSRGTPTAPMFIGQGTRGGLEGTAKGGAGIGAGDGVMVAGDVRSLARRYCSRGVTVQYQEYPLSHTTTAGAWLPQATSWLLARFAGASAPSSCGAIAPGNSLAPITVQR